LGDAVDVAKPEMFAVPSVDLPICISRNTRIRSSVIRKWGTAAFLPIPDAEPRLRFCEYDQGPSALATH
jgi:hypothetical protein